MNDLFEYLFEGLFRVVGISIAGEENERTQALVLFALCGVFGVVAGCFTSGLASTVWFVVGSVFIVLFLVAYWFVE